MENNEQKYFQYLAVIQTPNGVLNHSMGAAIKYYPSNNDLIKRVTEFISKKNVYVIKVDILSFSELSKAAYCAFFELDPETV